MTLGLVARAENRGLGILAWEIYRHMAPARTMVVEMGDLARGFPPHLDRYPDATVVPFRSGILDETVCREWLAGLDVVLMLETAYDWRFVGWAADAGCRTLLYVMPEFWRADVPQPDAIWNPTPWRHETLPGRARVVPVPVALDRFATPEKRTGGPLRVLHNVGHRAAMDRNGTAVVLAALRHIRGPGPVEVTISGQDGRLPAIRSTRHVQIVSRPRGGENYWDVPVGFDLLAMPRRYGGLCLPVQEAMAAGVVPLMPDVAPNDVWPTVPLRSRGQGEIRTQGGIVPLAHVDAPVLAAEISRLAEDPDEVAARRAAVLAWAWTHSWEGLRGWWAAEIARVLDEPALPR